MDVPLSAVRAIIEAALAEDVGWGDITTRSLVPPEHQGRAQALVKGEGILCGTEVFALAFTVWDPALKVDLLMREGSPIRRGDIVAKVEGSASSILTAERVALNFLQRLSGVATMTRRFVQEVGDLPTRVLETRKTTPGLRLLEKYAVRVGGGSNHRYNLSDGILIKDNHLAVLRAYGGDLREAITLARRGAPLTIKVEVEVTSVGEARTAAEAGAASRGAGRGASGAARGSRSAAPTRGVVRDDDRPGHNAPLQPACRGCGAGRPAAAPHLGCVV